ncbi:MAG: methyltransferase domain-containing protein [Rubrivivax sp.]|jgi:predicted TPR repeat methyltransferase|nr:methyltransferase domain-containing protein [Rubrivivax sp.]
MSFEQARDLFLEGLAALQRGELDLADTRFVASLEKLPGRPSTLMNLGAVRVARGRPDEALPVLDELLALEPDNAEAWGHRGTALAALDRHADAVAAFDRVLALLPQRPAALFQRASSLQVLGRVDEALEGFAAVTYAMPTAHLAWTQRGGILKDMGRLAEAAECFRQALAHGGDAELNRYFLASVQAAEGDMPAGAPRAYVQGLFDSYADSFDQHLVDRLGYRTPQLLASMLPEDGPVGAVLDLGCGTGLMAPLLADRARFIDGVDLSSAMLAKAGALGRYRHLHHGDVAEFMARTTERYGLVVAADVFVYVGDLAAVLAGAARVLEPGGRLLFSVEEADAGQVLQLRASSRFAHGVDAVVTLAQAHGLVLKALNRATLRHDQGRAIGGAMLLLQAGG